jgi:signal transduction histidine kinase/DNA-binding response OmpR family regulator
VDAPVTPHATQAPPADQPVEILVVDDLPEKLLVIQSILEDLGQKLVLARSGAEALREVLEREFAVILLDVNMPDIDGIETAQLIRQYRKSAHTPIIFITAYADEMQTTRGYSLGAVDYILSPVVPEVLRTKVKVFVELLQMQRRARAAAEERIALARAEAARVAAEQATRRSELLSFATRELGASLELEDGMRRLLELLVPGMAELALVSVTVDAEHDLVLERSGSEACVISRGHLPAAVAKAASRAGREGRRQELLVEGPRGTWPESLRAAQAIPLRAGEHHLGVLLLAASRPPPLYRASDQAMIDELASRAAIAFENARLYRSLKRESVRSQQAEAKLQDANRRKDEFLAMLSHELRNPLAPIRNAVEVIRRIAPSEPSLGWARDVIERQVTHMARLVDELLDVSRISSGKITLKKAPLELGKVIAHSVETVRPLVESRGHQLVVNVPQAPVWVFADFARLAQVLSNLLNNAAKYTQDGGRIELAASAREGEAVITVRDNGVGIDAELLPHVFELFAQGERSLDRSQGGLGVGLTLVQRVLELHQGRVEATSDGPGRGAEFRVTLPCIAPVLGAESAAGASEPQAAARGRRVLVVDDNADAAQSIAVFLGLEGHEVKTVTDASQALACCSVFAPQVIILDIGLPGMDGYELAQALAARPETRHALLIALTGYGQKEDRTHASEAGFTHHFVKPADPCAIQAVIAEWIGPQVPALGKRLGGENQLVR